MLNLICRELWVDFRREAKSFFHWILLWFFMNCFVVILFSSDFAFTQYLTPEVVSRFTTTFYLLFLFGIVFKNIPLRLSRGIYICPAGNREKRKYLLQQLFVKLAICLIVPGLLLYFGCGQIFLADTPLPALAQLQLWFFTFYNINLRIGVGEKNGRELDEKGYYKISHAEEMVTVYWLCLLILEWLGLLIFLLLDTGISHAAMGGIWCAALALNLFFAIRYTRPLLQEMCSYEKIYCQEVPEQIIQCDF